MKHAIFTSPTAIFPAGRARSIFPAQSICIAPAAVGWHFFQGPAAQWHQSIRLRPPWLSSVFAHPAGMAGYSVLLWTGVGRRVRTAGLHTMTQRARLRVCPRLRRFLALIRSCVARSQRPANLPDVTTGSLNLVPLRYRHGAKVPASHRPYPRATCLWWTQALKQWTSIAVRPMGPAGMEGLTDCCLP